MLPLRKKKIVFAQFTTNEFKIRNMVRFHRSCGNDRIDSNASSFNSLPKFRYGIRGK